VAAGAAGALSSGADAATVTVAGDELRFSAAAGEANRLTIGVSGGTVVFTDTGALITPLAGCPAGAPAQTVSCPSAGISLIRVDLGDGNDTLAVDPGVALRVVARGRDGKDTLAGGPLADTLFGDEGQDRLDGAGGGDDLNGGAGTDTADYSARSVPVTATLDGGADDGATGEHDRIAADVENALGGTAGDLLRGNALDNTLDGGPGDDRLQGLAGADVLDGDDGGDEAIYSEKSAAVTVTLDGSADDGTAGEHDKVLRVQDVTGGAGADVLTGNAQANVLRGGLGADTLAGNDDADVLVGGPGADTADGGGGKDTIAWAAGDGDDVVEGGTGTDTAKFTGSVSAETVALSDSAGRLRIARDVGGVVSAGDVERAQIVALGGPDTVQIGDLGPTPVTRATVEPGGADAAQDLVVVTGTEGPDTIATSLDGTAVQVAGLAYAVRIGGAAPPDLLTINALGGDDQVAGSPGLAGLVQLTVSAGEGDDTVTGGDGDDLLLTGGGGDVATGAAGHDVAQLGPGADRFAWNPGDGNDTVEGEAGQDSLVVTGSDADEGLFTSPPAGRLRLFRDVDATAVDAGGIEDLRVAPLAGADRVLVANLSQTELTAVTVDLGVDGAADGAADIVEAEGTQGDDGMTGGLSVTGVQVSGMPYSVAVDHPESDRDGLVLFGSGGADVLACTGALATRVQPTLDGGDGDDTLIGSEGRDVLRGNAGDDTVDGDTGDDVVELNDGDDTAFVKPTSEDDDIDGGPGADTLTVNGSSAADTYRFLAVNDGSLQLTRNVTANVWGVRGVEDVDVRPLAGADSVTVNAIGATDVARVNVDLAATLGGSAGDGELDRVFRSATNGVDSLFVAGNSSAVAVSGLGTVVGITNHDPALDELRISTLAGADTVNTLALLSGAIKLFVDGVAQ